MALSDRSLVSIITPAYNAAGYIADTIRKVQEQRYPHWEMLITNDCSKDNTQEVVSEIAKKDSRVKLLEHAINSGPAIARQTSIRAAQGEVIAFLDSDDYWPAHKLERQLEFMRTNDYEFTFTAYRRIRETDGPTGKLIEVPKSICYRQLLRNTAIATSTVMLERARVGDIKMTPGLVYDDFILWLDILRRGVIAHGLNEDLMRYRLLSSSISHDKTKSAQAVWRIYREHEKLNLLSSAFNFVGYGVRGYLKHRTF